MCNEDVRFNMTIESTLLYFPKPDQPHKSTISLTPGCMTNDPHAVGMDLSFEMVRFKW